MTRLVFLIILAAQLLVSVANADVGDSDSQYDPGPAERRWGFAAGFSVLAMAGGVSGYPRNVEQIGVSEFEASTGAAGGAGGGLWIGAALRDWLVVGLGITGGSVAGADAVSSNGGAFVFHIEGFPLFYRGGAWKDFALLGEFGAGARDIFDASREVAESGAISYASLGLLYEPFRIGHRVSAGPVVYLTHQFSDSMRATLATAGIQLAFYGGSG